MSYCILNNEYSSNTLNKIVFGIQRNINDISSKWVRTDDSANMTAYGEKMNLYQPSSGSAFERNYYCVQGFSDFDNYYPGKGMVRETLSTGDVMVKIPKFWYKRAIDTDIEYIKIANEPVEGFEVHPAFLHNNTTQDYIYVGAHLNSLSSESNMYVSRSDTYISVFDGETLKPNMGSSECKTNRESGWSSLDISTLSAIQMLYLVEFADNNSQNTIGTGGRLPYSSYPNNRTFYTGKSNFINSNNLTGCIGFNTEFNTNFSISYRGIEDLGSTIAGTYIDGLVLLENGDKTGISNNQSDYSSYVDPSSASNNYRRLDYNASSVQRGLILKMSNIVSKSGLLLPIDTDNNLSILNIYTIFNDFKYHYCSYHDYNVNLPVSTRLGYSLGGSTFSDYDYAGGLFTIGFKNIDGYAATGRLLYVPIQ